jgi:hypothetical protein
VVNDFAADEAKYDQLRREAGFILLIPVLSSCKHARLAVLGKAPPALKTTQPESTPMHTKSTPACASSIACIGCATIALMLTHHRYCTALASNPRVTFKRKSAPSQPSQSQPANSATASSKGPQVVSLRIADPHLRLLDHLLDVFKECIELPCVSKLLRVYHILMSDCDHHDIMKYG